MCQTLEIFSLDTNHRKKRAGPSADHMSSWPFGRERKTLNQRAEICSSDITYHVHLGGYDFTYGNFILCITLSDEETEISRIKFLADGGCSSEPTPGPSQIYRKDGYHSITLYSENEECCSFVPNWAFSASFGYGDISCELSSRGQICRDTSNSFQPNDAEVASTVETHVLQRNNHVGG